MHCRWESIQSGVTRFDWHDALMFHSWTSFLFFIANIQLVSLACRGRLFRFLFPRPRQNAKYYEEAKLLTDAGVDPETL